MYFNTSSSSNQSNNSTTTCYPATQMKPLEKLISGGPPIPEDLEHFIINPTHFTGSRSTLKSYL